MSPDTERTEAVDVERIATEVETLRRELHAHPEVSDHERETARRVRRFLSERGVEPLATDVGGHGLLYRVENVVPDGKRLLLRADLDALPLQEQSGVGHAATVHGVHHACGHDGHTAMLVGALLALKELGGDDGGAVYALFQPAEETGQGGDRVLSDDAVRSLDPDLAFAFHNIPGEPLGTALLRAGPMACASTGIHLRLEGATSHASEPQHGRNPIPALSRLALAVEGLVAQVAPHDEAALATLIELRAGEVAYGTSAGAGGLRVTLRASTDEIVDRLFATLADHARGEAEAGGFVLKVEEHERFPATLNHADAVSRVRAAFAAADLHVRPLARPYGWSEDFGHLTGRWPGALIGLGSGEDQPPLHSPGYDFPDALIPLGIRAWLALVEGGRR